MAGIQDLQAINEHPNTGAVRFVSDWPGVFIRGDEALALASDMRAVASSDASNSNKLDMALDVMRRVATLLETCRVGAR